MELLEHFILAPATNEGDDLRVDVFIKQGIGSRGMKTAFRDVRSSEIDIWYQVCDTILQHYWNMCWSYWALTIYRVLEGEQGVWIILVFAQVSYTTNNVFDWE